jgi:hypothetical protein
MRYTILAVAALTIGLVSPALASSKQAKSGPD